MSVIIETKNDKVHKDLLDCDGGDNLGLKKIRISVRADADQKYFREEISQLFRS